MNKKLNILFIEPFYADSHKQWLDQLVSHSSHSIRTLTLPGKYWKWRMHGGAITLARMFMEIETKPDLIICSSMLDIATFTSLLRKQIHQIPIAIYFHENQISYPWNPADLDVELNRDRHYGFINYSSALTADKIFFNSEYHRSSFLNTLHPFLKAFPDYENLESIENIENKSEVLYLGLDFKKLEQSKIERNNEIPVILWNHRWEFDKNPNSFFNTLFNLKKEKLEFRLIVLGKQYARYPKIFDKAKEVLKSEIIHWGYAESLEEYHQLLWKADILPVSSIQDFFGISVVEAIYCNTIPLLPNRLAYPEHLKGVDFFYNSEEEFYSKLEFLIKNIKDHVSPDLSIISKYDWNLISEKYDNAFSRLCPKKK